MPIRGIKKQKAIIKERELKVFYNEEVLDQPFPELTRLDEIKYQGGKLKDINPDEGRNLINIAIPGGQRALAGLDTVGNLIKEVINTKLDTQTKQILGDFTFGVSGAIKIITDANNGIWISPTGILGKKAGATTFTLTNTGDATFKGEVLAGSIISADISADRITAGTLTGRTVQTAASGRRIVLNNVNNSIIIYGSDGYAKFSIYENLIAWETNPWILSPSTDLLEIRFPIPIADIRSLFFTRGTGAAVKIYGSPGSDIEVPTLIPSGTNNLGSSTYRWQNLHLSGQIFIAADGKVNTDIIDFRARSAPSSPEKGFLYFDSTVNKLKVYNGSAWETISSA